MMITLRAFRPAVWAVVAAAIAWGARLVLIEGFIDAWPRGFVGDFHVVLYGTKWTGRSILYGPVIVVERWLANTWPGVFTIYPFAIVNAVLLVVAFVCCIRVLRPSALTLAVGLALWLCYWRLFYALSVAAHPEILEVALLCGALLAAALGRDALEGGLIAGAGLTKLIPWIFMEWPLLRQATRAIAVAAVLVVVSTAVMCVGLHLSPIRVLVQTFVPIDPELAAATGGGSAIVAQAGSPQFLGVYEAIARRLFDAPSHVLSLADQRAVQEIGDVVLVGSLLMTLYGVWRLRRRGALTDPARTALAYALLFTVVPILTIYTHGHTFVFLLPVWLILPALLANESGSIAVRAMFTAVFGVAYVLTGFPQVFTVIDRIFHSQLVETWLVGEPIIGNVILLVALVAYALRMASLPVLRDAAMVSPAA